MWKKKLLDTSREQRRSQGFFSAVLSSVERSPGNEIVLVTCPVWEHVVETGALLKASLPKTVYCFDNKQRALQTGSNRTPLDESFEISAVEN